LVLSHGALLSVAATHATALDTYLFWRRSSTRRGTSFQRWVIKAVKMLQPEIRTIPATVQTGPSSMVVTYLSVLQVCRLFMHLHIGVNVFFHLLGFVVIILFLTFFFLATTFFFKIGAI